MEKYGKLANASLALPVRPCTFGVRHPARVTAWGSGLSFAIDRTLVTALPKQNVCSAGPLRSVALRLAPGCLATSSDVFARSSSSVRSNVTSSKKDQQLSIPSAMFARAFSA